MFLILFKINKLNIRILFRLRYTIGKNNIYAKLNI